MKFMDDQINIGDWTFLGSTVRILKVIGMSSPPNDWGVYDVFTVKEGSTGIIMDVERIRLLKIKDTNKINELNLLYPD